MWQHTCTCRLNRCLWFEGADRGGERDRDRDFGLEIGFIVVVC